MKLSTREISTYRTEIMGLCCMYVIISHNFFNWPDVFSPLRRFADCGNIAVDIFLMLSGIGLYFSFRRGSSLAGYYKKRIIRLLVPYIFTAVPFYLWYSAAGNGVFWKDVLNISLFEHGMRITWYPVAAFLCYLIFPFIYWFQNRPIIIHNKRLDSDCLTLSFCLLWLLGLCTMKKLCPDFYQNSEIMWTRIPIFVIGCRVGAAVEEDKTISRGAVPAALFLIIVYLYIFRREVSLPDLWIRMSYIPLSFAFLTVFLYMAKRTTHTMIGSVLRFFGKRSFEIYLVHVLLIRVWKQCFGSQLFDRYEIFPFVLIIAASLLVSAILFPVVGFISGLLLKPYKRTQ